MTMVVVPDVVGHTQPAATTLLTGAGLTLGPVTTQSSATVASGSVISENPAAGASVAKGSAVAIVVSSGPPATVSVPNVVGLTEFAAKTTITGRGLTPGTVTTQTSATVPSGVVISENPAAGTSVASGSAVDLVVSTGAATSTPTLGGIVIGLTSGQTVHVLNGADNVPVASNTAFTFPTALTTGAAYAVTVGTPQPTGQTCAVQNGSGTAASSNITNVVVYCTTNVTAATLTGPYTAVTNAIDQQSNALVNVTWDGIGTYSGSGTLNTNTVITATTISGTYAVGPVNSIPILVANNGKAEGALEFNANTVVALTSVVNGMQPGLFIAVKPTQNATVSFLNGTYDGVTLESTTTPSSSSVLFTANNGTGTAGPSTRNFNGTISTDPNVNTGPYTLSASGAITFGTGGAGISGGVSADGDLIVLAPITSNGNGSTPGIYVAVKQGSGVTAATINGVYTMVSLSTTATAAAVDGRAYNIAMANGAFFGVYDENNAGTISLSNLVSGTYTVAADGTLNLVVTGGPALAGTVSADGNVFVLGAFTSGEEPTLLVGVRQ